MSSSYSSFSFPPNWKIIIDPVSPLKFIPTGGTSIVYQNYALFSMLFVNFIFYIQYMDFRLIKKRILVFFSQIFTFSSFLLIKTNHLIDSF